MPIQLLDEQVISQIAAGEVVERPASVVKELIENSLDAGASYIQVDVEHGGQKLIRISDDGHGIPASEISLSYARHATSKLQIADDLYRIATLGFRGEALSSVVAVSQTTLTSRHRDEATGTQTRIEGGIVTQQREVGTPAGTIITVENLFYNMPVRLKFLKTENTEKRQITNIIMQYAMAYPHVRFVLVHDDRETFRSSGSGQLADVIVKVLGLSQFKQMIEVRGAERIQESVNQQIQIEGYVSEPDLHRKDRNRVFLFVNGRSVQDNNLTYAVTQAYHTLLPKGRYPFAILMIRLPSEFVDVNVHPTKAEVRFRDANSAFIAVQRVVRQALMSLNYSDAMRIRTPNTTGNRWSSSQSGEQQTAFDGYDEWGNQITSQSTVTSDTLPTESGDFASIPTGLGRPARPRTLPPLRVVGQVGASYIIAEGPAGLYLIDQHTAHIRILFQQFMDDRQSDTGIRFHEVEAQTINLSSSETKVMEALVPQLDQWGISIEPFGMTSFVIRALPTILDTQYAEDMLATILKNVQATANDQIDHLIPENIARYCAYRSGRILKMDEMQTLVQSLERCPSPLSSPDGRPTLIHISAEQLASEFMTPQQPD